MGASPLPVLFFFRLIMTTEEKPKQFIPSGFVELDEYFVDAETAKTVNPVDNEINELLIIKPYEMASITRRLSPMNELLYRDIDSRIVGPDKYKISPAADYRHVKKMIEFKSTDKDNMRRARIILSNSSTQIALLNLFTVNELDGEGLVYTSTQYLLLSLRHNEVHSLTTADTIASWIKLDQLSIADRENIQGALYALN